MQTGEAGLVGRARGAHRRGADRRLMEWSRQAEREGSQCAGAHGVARLLRAAGASEPAANRLVVAAAVTDIDLTAADALIRLHAMGEHHCSATTGCAVNQYRQASRCIGKTEMRFD